MSMKKYVYFAIYRTKSLFSRLIPRKKAYSRTATTLAFEWIQKYSVENKGIAVTSLQPHIVYPEVTGYFIPTLLTWGEREKAFSFADYLVSIQNDDGSWNAPDGDTPYTFDIGQILKGLMSLVNERPEYKENIIRGCDWILSQQREDGSIATPDYTAWALPNNQQVPEAVHLYAMSPLSQAAEKWNIPRFDVCVRDALNFYLKQKDLTEFNTLSHFHAYIIEALIDLGEVDRARTAMHKVQLIQKNNGSIPAYNNEQFVCSTGLLQYAICWYKLGELKNGNKAFSYAVSLQNPTGGWYGSYGAGANYFPHAEISWAVKYFLDALYWKIQREFDAMTPIFPTQISPKDGRYQLIEEHTEKTSNFKVLDVGCGKGRFISLLKNRKNAIDAHGIDLSEEILSHVSNTVKTKQGSILRIPHPDNTFDLTFCIETLEHSVRIEAAVKEMVRVTKPGGTLIIIDKNNENLGAMELSEWECWFDSEEMTRIMENEKLTVRVRKNIAYDNNRQDDLFIGWIGKKDE